MRDDLYNECIGRFPPERPNTVRCKTGTGEAQCGTRLGEIDFAFTNSAMCRECVIIEMEIDHDNEVAA